MSQSWPVNLQAALLYDRAEPVAVTSIMQNFLKIEHNVARLSYNVVGNTGTYVQLYCGARDLMIAAEWVDKPTNPAAFEQALASPYNAMFAAPDARNAIARHRGYFLINVHHGVIPPTVLDKEFMARLNLAQAGQSTEHYIERLRVLGLVASLACDASAPTLAHWTFSEVLTRPELIDAVMPDAGPSPISVHPFMFRPADAHADEVGFQTFGARHYIGREIRMRASVVPVLAAYQHALGFMRVALRENGYVIPHGDTFGDDEGTFCYRVHHDGAPVGFADPDAPSYEIEPLLHAETGFRSPDYVPPDIMVDLDNATRLYQNFAGRDGKRAVDDWRNKRAVAEKAGVKFQVKATPGFLHPKRKSVFGRLCGAK